MDQHENVPKEISNRMEDFTILGEYAREQGGLPLYAYYPVSKFLNKHGLDVQVGKELLDIAVHIRTGSQKEVRYSRNPEWPFGDVHATHRVAGEAFAVMEYTPTGRHREDVPDDQQVVFTALFDDRQTGSPWSTFRAAKVEGIAMAYALEEGRNINEGALDGQYANKLLGLD